MNDDLISRRVATELIHSLYPSEPIMQINRKQWKKKYKPYIEIEKLLKWLPPVPLEIIYCKDCRYFDKYFVKCLNEKGLKHISNNRNFCSNAERRTDE